MKVFLLNYLVLVAPTQTHGHKSVVVYCFECRMLWQVQRIGLLQIQVSRERVVPTECEGVFKIRRAFNDAVDAVNQFAEGLILYLNYLYLKRKVLSGKRMVPVKRNHLIIYPGNHHVKYPAVGLAQV